MSSLTYDRQTQTLECLTLGGPPTNLIWSKDNVQLNFFGSEKYSLSQIVIDPLTSLYNNKLKIFNKSKVDSGTYKCSVTNAISEDSVQYTISGNKNLYPSLHFLNSFIFIYAKFFKSFIYYYIDIILYSKFLRSIKIISISDLNF